METLYALLEVDPGATEDEVRRSFKRLMQLFDTGGVVIYGLYGADEVNALRERLTDAYDVLLTPEKRRRYDRDLFPEGHPSLRRADERVAAAPPVPRPEAPKDPLAALNLPESTVINGTILHQVREVCHLTFEEIADRTKISIFALKCIEADQYGDLPAPIYLKGFLKQISLMLRLDAEKVCVDYMGLVDVWKSEQANKRPW